jgi:YD repeat-containing protein
MAIKINRRMQAIARISILFLSMLGLMPSRANAELISSETTYAIYPTHRALLEKYRFEPEAKEACYNFATAYNYNPQTSCGFGSTGDQPRWSAGWLHVPGTNNFVLGTFYGCSPSQRYFEDVAKCVSVVALQNAPRDPGNNGSQCSLDPRKKQPCLFDPINPGTGNMWNSETDYAAASSSLHLSRTYNSGPYNVDADVVRSFGARWTQAYDVKVAPDAAQANGIQGACWRRQDTAQIWCETPIPSSSGSIPDAVSIVRGDGKKYLFSRDGDTWVAKKDISARLSATFSSDKNTILEWTYVSENGDRTEQFDAAGRLTKIIQRTGEVQRLTYSDGQTNDTSAGRVPADAPICGKPHSGGLQPLGRLLCVTDNWGRQLQFEYDDIGRIVKLSNPENKEITYVYDGPSGGCPTPDRSNRACAANNLTQINYPDGSSKKYYYNEKDKINNGQKCANTVEVGNGFGHLLHSMTGVEDENGRRHVNWTYDCSGLATSTFLAGGVNKAALTYATMPNGQNSTTVTHYLGDPSNPSTTVSRFDYQVIQGISKNATIINQCAQCGVARTRTYDANGNVTSAYDWNNNLTCYGYDLSRNLETMRVEGAGSSASCTSLLTATTLAAPIRKTTTEWHSIFRLPTRIAEAARITVNQYDDKGNLLSRSEQATTDANGSQGFNASVNGSARVWTYSYNDVGQVISATDPRGGVTAYGYDDQGNLASITNAVGHVTTLADYDASGRVGRIITPDGVVTELTYSPRGWLTSRTVAGEVTTYEYDGVGQLKKLMLPDSSFITYTYDDAHRVTGASDSLGNSIRYTLDAMGNRTKEEVRDPSGALARQITRAYDTLNRLKEITGGAQ